MMQHNSILLHVMHNFCNYGNNMCMKFFQGQQWIDSVRLCLINELVHSSVYTQNGTCSEISSFAYASHPKCYTSAGFCDVILPKWRNLWGLIRTINISHLIKGWREICSTLVRCHRNPRRLPRFLRNTCHL